MIDLIFSGRNVFILYLVLAGSFLQSLFPCNTTKLFTESPIIRHLLGFFTLIFFVVITDTEIDDYMPLGSILTTSAIIYAWFLVSSKMTANWWLALVVLLGILYMIDMYELRAKVPDPERSETLETAKNWVLGLSLAITLVGFLIYVGEKKLDYKSKFNWTSFFFSTTNCKGTPNIQPYWKSFKAAFMEPPGTMIGGGMPDTSFLDALASSGEIRVSTLT
jgi:hypothetical protein